MALVTMREALNQALREEMRREDALRTLASWKNELGRANYN